MNIRDLALASILGGILGLAFGIGASKKDQAAFYYDVDMKLHSIQASLSRIESAQAIQRPPAWSEPGYYPAPPGVWLPTNYFTNLNLHGYCYETNWVEFTTSADTTYGSADELD